MNIHTYIYLHIHIYIQLYIHTYMYLHTQVLLGNDSAVLSSTPAMKAECIAALHTLAFPNTTATANMLQQKLD